MVVELSWKFSLKFELISGGLGNNNNANMGGTGQNTYTSNSFYVDPRATFEAFFGTSNPFENFFNIHNSSSGLFTDHLNADHNNMTDNLDDPFAFSSLGGGLNFGNPTARTPFRSHSFNVGPRKEKPQDPPIEHDLYVSLEDINRGVTKRMKISRRVVANDGTVRKEEKVLAINVKPGWKSGTKITFQREGDQAPNKIPADIVFIIRDKPHPHFKREGSDLKYTCQISLKEVRTDHHHYLHLQFKFPVHELKVGIFPPIFKNLSFLSKCEWFKFLLLTRLKNAGNSNI